MILRSTLYVPATRPELYEKALASDADAVIVDLEDAVAPDRKAEGRATLVTLLGGTGGGATARPTKPVYVRINALGTALAYADIEAGAGLPFAGVRVPKVESAEQVRTVAGWLDGTGFELWCLIESAIGLERAFEIASAHPAVASISIGEVDLAASLRITGDAGLAYARGRCIAAARAAGLDSPMLSVYTHVKDADGLRASCIAGKALGFFGRNCIHPDQIVTVNEVFTPSEEDVMRAKEVLAVMAGAVETGAGALALPDGRFLDIAFIEQAKATLALATRVGAC